MDLREKIVSDEDTLTLSSSDSPFSLPLRIDTFHDEKELDKYVKNVERLIRYSPEYKQWVAYIIEVIGHKSCALTEETMSECNVDIHHHPITLFTVCKGVISKFINSGQKFCSFDISTEVIELHFKNKIGYIPLLSDLHKKYHSGYLELPIELVNGDYLHILKNYTIDDYEKERICSLCNIRMSDETGSTWSKGNYPGIKDEDI